MSGAPIETIRRAAELMRKRAKAATKGPWTIADSYPNALVVSDDYSLTVAEVNDLRPDATVKDAAYIAAMHPIVALAVADWLDSVASAFHPLTTPQPHGEVGQALAVARVYLKED
jgi:hypothetical protein